jgi:RNA polymerase sigma-70 factor (ECF subfamily)
MNAEADPDPEQLLYRARSGSTAALGRLLERYRNYLALLARLQIGRANSILRTWFRRRFWRPTVISPNSVVATKQSLVNWLRQILAMNLANLVRHYYGTQRRDVRLERELALDLDQSSRVLDRGLVAAQSSPSQQAARREQAVLLADALDRLPQDYREVIILRHLEGLTFPEVAQRLGRTVDSVEKLWARGLARLRRSLGVKR